MTAPFAGLPAMSTTVSKMRQDIHNELGFHTLLDAPVECFEQHMPKTMVAGIKVSVLVYTLNNNKNPSIRIAVGDDFAQTNSNGTYNELGFYAKSTCRTTLCGYFKNSPEATNKKQNISLKANTFYWFQFLMDVGSIKGTWLISDQWEKLRKFQQSVNFKVGGSLMIIGTYKKTAVGDDKMSLAFQQQSKSELILLDPPAEQTGHVELYCTIERGQLLLTYQDKVTTCMHDIDETRTVQFSVKQNLDISSIVMRSGMINAECAPLPD
ncbi:uncharacterized protein LOC135378508 isoform X2 [Ornithodoros turicata]|uniref:uncharacterized protein LOC135378508 isoform X2 n=1 Tax=Ornithodoros turicata TaxID=34597 RepID=UPI003139D049